MPNTDIAAVSTKGDRKQHCHYKVLDPATIAREVAKLRADTGQTIATLNGSFDLLHSGHLHILNEASQHADILIVALNSDSSIKAYKSSDRPIIALEDRMRMMAALQCVDYVTWFDETDPRQILAAIKPDVHVNGSEYGTDCIEAPVVIDSGGTVVTVDLVPGLSTTAIIERIQTLCD